MQTCATCGHRSAEPFKFCPECGTPAPLPALAREQRKVVTVVFCDVTNSTVMGERLDPEALRELLAAYFERVRAVVLRHGGTVEKFIGDAVMAVFGIPVLHEDDALRAVRAAAEMHEVVAELGLQVRVGVATGEVIVGTVERLATGDTVNLAARLEQAAPPGSVVLSAETFRLAGATVRADPMPPFRVKGKAQPVQAFLLAGFGDDAEAVARHFDLPLVGRDEELELLGDVFAEVRTRGELRLVTVLGPAGIGKTRLAHEFAAGVDARAVAGHCLSYGEGITYWPVLETVRALDPDALPGLLDGSTVEIARRVCDLLETAAAEGPVVVVWDDLHWAEPTFLDLVEHVAGRARGPILLLCLARPDLVEVRPALADEGTALVLDSLAAEHGEALVERIAPGLAPELRARILEAADGNPLFVEEMAAIAADTPDAGVPPTIQALLAARIDQLAAEERAALECGAIEGHVFHRGGVRALVPEVERHLHHLVRKQLVRPGHGLLPDEEAFRFRHILIREAAYEALPKARRAELHEQLAEWLAAREVAVELDELIGYHLEQAHAYRRELGRPGEALGERAAARLTSAGRAALARRDATAASSLLARAAALLDDDHPSRPSVLADLADAHVACGRLAEALPVLAEAHDAARATGDAHVAARAAVHRLAAGMHRGGADLVERRALEETVAAAEAIAADAASRGDDRVLAQARILQARAWFVGGRCADAAPHADEAYEAAGRSGDRWLAQEALSWRAVVVRFGPMSVERAAAFYRGLEEEGVALDGLLLTTRGELAALGGDVDAGRADVARAIAAAEEARQLVPRGGFAAAAGIVELLAGDLAAAERELRIGWDILGTLGESGFRATVGGLLAETLVELERLDEAEDLAAEALALARDEDWEPQARCRTILARLALNDGDTDRAVDLARDAVDLVAETDYLDTRGWITAAAADVLAAAGRHDDAQAAAAEAVDLFERKGALAAAARVRRRFAVQPA